MTDDKRSRVSSVVIDGDRSSGGDSKGSSLTPMLIGGLVLVVLGGIIVMMFV